MTLIRKQIKNMAIVFHPKNKVNIRGLQKVQQKTSVIAPKCVTRLIYQSTY